MRKYSDRAGLSTLSEINVTPLLDLAFVLLIIFMISTPLLDQSIELQAPTSDAATTDVDPRLVRVISIDRLGVIFLGEDEISSDALEGRLMELKNAGELEAVVIRADRDLGVQRLVDIMDALQRTGITRAGVVTQRPGQ